MPHTESATNAIGWWMLVILVGIGMVLFVYWLLRKGSKEDKEHFEAWRKQNNRLE